MLGQVRGLERHLARHGVSSLPMQPAHRMYSSRQSRKLHKDAHTPTAMPSPVTDVPSTSSCHCEVVEEAPSCSGSLPSSWAHDSLALLALELGITNDQVAWLSRARPELLHRPTSRLRTRLQGLAGLLGCSVAQAACMTQKQPTLLDIEAECIHQRLTRLTAGLGGDRRRASGTARRMPRLLASDEHITNLEQHMQHLHTIFSPLLSVDVGALAVKEPQLLVMEPSQIRQRVHALAACLEVQDQEQLLRICYSHPWLLTVSPASLDSKVATLGSAMHLGRSTALQLVRSYPRILQLSEQGMVDKTAALSKVFPRHVLQCMVCREPSLLTRSCAKILQSWHATQQATGMPTQAAMEVVAKRPGILTRSSLAPARCFRALSVWRLSAEEKRELVQAHPILLRLSPREVHLRCRWLRQLMTSNGLYHSTFRRLPIALLGVLMSHLPLAWSRLQYLAESSQEVKMELMDVVQSEARRFDARFPNYRRWLHFKTSEMGCQVPWRIKAQQRKQSGEQRPAFQGNGTADGPSTSAGAPEDDTAPYSWHAASGSPSHRPLQQTVVGEADIIYYGVHPVRKPRRIVYTSSPQPGMQPPARTQPPAGQQPTASTRPTASTQPTASARPATSPRVSAGTRPASSPQPAASVEAAATPQPSAGAQPSDRAQPRAGRQPALGKQLPLPSHSSPPTHSPSPADVQEPRGNHVAPLLQPA